MINYFESIREDNKKKYGTDIHRYGPVLLANLYSDKTHFVYELLQNAEDACERAKRAGLKRKFYVRFSLFKDRLELRHNGIEFNKDDVVGICGLVEGTKAKDLSQIGKFGIGFKSVYAYTDSPQIYSGDRRFRIENYVQPYEMEDTIDLNHDETLFVIPFDHKEISSEKAFSEISNRLKKLGMKTLLFLRNIEEISWTEGNSTSKENSGKYQKKLIKEIKNNIKKIRLSQVSGSEHETEDWLIFSKPITENVKEGFVEIAYSISTNKETKKDQINPISRSELIVYFPTEKETHLKFLIQGPYRTTPARDNIPFEDIWNKKLIQLTAELISESIPLIKELNLLDANFLQILPLESEYFEGTLFSEIFRAVKEKLSDEEPLLPTYDGSYVNASHALLGGSEGLRKLLSAKQLSLLVKKDRCKWLDAQITADKTPVLRQYLMDVLEIEEITLEKFARLIDIDFLQSQSDTWMNNFYNFLIDKEMLWRPAGRWDWEGPLRGKPFIRLENDDHVAPFKSEKIPAVYLPFQEEQVSRHNKSIPTVKSTIASNEKALSFLKKLGLKEPDNISYILEIILPQYQKDEIDIEEKQNLKHVKLIAKAITSSNEEQISSLLSQLSETSFLLAKNLSTNEKVYKKPQEIYLGKIYTGDKTLDVYFHDNPDIWFLDDSYISIQIDNNFFKKVGCITSIRVIYKTSEDGFVYFDWRYGKYKRGVDEFDPNCMMEGLEFVIEHITNERARIIWELIQNHAKRIYGRVEESRFKRFIKLSSSEETFSVMGKILYENAWLPDTSGNFHKPTELYLSDLPENFQINNITCSRVSEKLQFKQDAEQQLIGQLSPEKKKLYEKLKSIPDESIIKKVLKILDEEVKKPVEVSLDDFRDDFTMALKDDTQSSEEADGSEKYTGMHPEEEEKIREEFGQQMVDRLKTPRSIIKQNVSIRKSIIDKDAIDPKEFLYEQYNGHCQICNTILNIGEGKRPYISIYRINETKGKNWWANEIFNVLSLCPNCHILLKHGGRDLSNTIATAEKVLKNELAPEVITERRGDYYIVPIQVAGKNQELFYSPKHMQTIAAFLKNTKTK